MKNKGLFSSLVLGPLLAVGFLAVWGVVGVIVLENGMMIAHRNSGGDSLSTRADGRVLIAHYENGAVTHRDLNGKPVTLPDAAADRWFSAVSLPASLPWRKEHADWDERARPFTDGRMPQANWYFIADGRSDGTAYFVGYDRHSKARIGYLGIGGFRAELPPPEEHFPFAGATTGNLQRVFCVDQDGRPHHVRANRGTFSVDSSAATSGIVYILGLDRTIYLADLRNRTVRAVVHARDLRAVALIDDIADPSHRNWRLAVRTDAVVLVLDRHGKEERRYPIPEEVREEAFTFGETTTGEAVMQWSKEGDMMDTEQVHRLFWVRSDGQTRTAEVALPHEPFREMRYLMAGVLPSPLVLDGVGVVRSAQLQDDGLTPTFAAALSRTVEEFWPAGVLAQLLAAALAVFCYRRQRRYGVGPAERIAWPLFVLLLGLPGWIGYRFCRKWPVLEACADCGAAVPRDRENCVRCANDFPRPALKGTEVFA